MRYCYPIIRVRFGAARRSRLGGRKYELVSIGGGAGQSDRCERDAFSVGYLQESWVLRGDEGDDLGEECGGGDLSTDQIRACNAAWTAVSWFPAVARCRGIST